MFSIEWGQGSVDTLSSIIKQINNRKIAIELEKLSNVYIEFNGYLLNRSNYGMNLSEESSHQADHIKDGEYKLAYICELYIMQRELLIESSNKKYKMTSKDVYMTMGNIIFEGIQKLFTFQEGSLGFKELYLISMMKRIMDSENIKKAVTTVYFLIIRLTYSKGLVYKLDTLITMTENLDINILTKQELSELMEILNIKRKLYAKIFLVLLYEIIHIKNMKTWIDNICNISNMEEFTDMLTNPLLEFIIYDSTFDM